MRGIKLKIGVWGFESSHDEITKKIGVNPSSIKIKGERSSGNVGVILKENGWLYERHFPDVFDIEATLKEFFNDLSGCWNNIVNISTMYYTELSCIIYTDDSNPGISLDPTLINFFCGSKITIDFDIYCLESDSLLDDE